MCLLWNYILKHKEKLCTNYDYTYTCNHNTHNVCLQNVCKHVHPTQFTQNEVVALPITEHTLYKNPLKGVFTHCKSIPTWNVVVDYKT